MYLPANKYKHDYSGGGYIRKGKKNSRVVEKLKNFDIQQKPNEEKSVFSGETECN